MKKNYIAKHFFALLCLFTSATFLRAEMNETIIRAIEGSDPDTLSELFMPGFCVNVADKKQYLTKARLRSNQTFSDLYKFSGSDFFKLLRGTLKLAAGSFFAYTGYQYYKKRFEWVITGNQTIGASTPTTGTPAVANALNNSSFQPLDEMGKGILYGALGFLSIYFWCKGFSEFGAIASKDLRFKKHRDALAVEAIVQRIACQNDE